MTASMTLRTKRKNKKHKTKTEITDINHQYFRKLIKNSKNLTHIGYKKKQVHNEQIEA